MKTKHPVKVGEVLYPPGTEVRAATLAEMRSIWPGITTRSGSPQAGVWFPGMPVPTILHTSQLEGVTYPIGTWNAPANETTTEHALRLAKEWCVNAALTGKKRLARYYLRKAVALECEKSRAPTPGSPTQP